jgi:hypothetical protein
LKEIFDELDLEVADALCCDLCIDDAIGPAAEIDSSGGKSFVHRHQEISSAQNAALRTESLLHGFTESDAGIFDGVMLIHIKIATGVHVQIKCAMTRNEFQHMVEEANASGDASFSAAVEIQLETNVRFVRFAMNCGGAWHFDFS